jgi:hypothetical protein
MVPPHELFTAPIEDVVLGVHITFIGLPNASEYQEYAMRLGAFLRHHHFQKSTFSEQGAALSVSNSSLDKQGFPKPDHPKTKDSSNTTPLRKPDPSKRYHYADKTVDISQCHPSQVHNNSGDDYYNSNGYEWQSGVVEARTDTLGFPEGTGTISDTDEDVIDLIGDEIFGRIHWRASCIHSDIMALDAGPYEAQAEVAVSDEDEAMADVGDSKHQLFVDAVQDIYDNAQLLSPLLARRKVRNFVKRSQRNIDLLKESISEFEKLITSQDDEVDSSKVDDASSSETVGEKPKQSHTMQTDAVSEAQANSEFLAQNRTSDGGRLTMGDQIGFHHVSSDMFGCNNQRPVRNAKVSKKLGNTVSSLSSVDEEYYAPEKKKGTEFFAFGM